MHVIEHVENHINDNSINKLNDIFTKAKVDRKNLIERMSEEVLFTLLYGLHSMYDCTKHLLTKKI